MAVKAFKLTRITSCRKYANNNNRGRNYYGTVCKAGYTHSKGLKALILIKGQKNANHA